MAGFSPRHLLKMIDKLNCKYKILVCCGSRCSVNDSKLIKAKIEELLKKYNLDKDTFVFYNGCFGLCRLGPVIEIVDPIFYKTNYCLVNTNNIEDIIKSHLIDYVQYKSLMLENVLKEYMNL